MLYPICTWVENRYYPLQTPSKSAPAGPADWPFVPASNKNSIQPLHRCFCFCWCWAFGSDFSTFRSYSWSLPEISPSNFNLFLSANALCDRLSSFSPGCRIGGELGGSSRIENALRKEWKICWLLPYFPLGRKCRLWACLTRWFCNILPIFYALALRNAARALLLFLLSDIPQRPRPASPPIPPSPRSRRKTIRNVGIPECRREWDLVSVRKRRTLRAAVVSWWVEVKHRGSRSQRQ